MPRVAYYYHATAQLCVMGCRIPLNDVPQTLREIWSLVSQAGKHNGSGHKCSRLLCRVLPVQLGEQFNSYLAQENPLSQKLPFLSGNLIVSNTESTALFLFQRKY